MQTNKFTWQELTFGDEAIQPDDVRVHHICHSAHFSHEVLRLLLRCVSSNGLHGNLYLCAKLHIGFVHLTKLTWEQFSIEQCMLSAHYKTHVGTTPSPMGSNPDRADRGMYSASCWRADREEGVACDRVAARDQTNRQHHKMIPRIHYIPRHLPPPTHTVLTGFGPLWSRLIAIFILLLNNEPVERVGSEEDNQ